MKIYTVEIEGIAEMEAESKEEAIQKVKELFESDELSYENLWFTCNDENE